jgi:very-short-patch-repair endonuclease
MQQDSQDRNVPDDVQGFIDKVSRKIGEFYAGIFQTECYEHSCFVSDNSPIKQLLFTSLNAIAHVWNRNIAAELKIVPQKEIGDYCVDFLVSLSKVDGRGNKTKHYIIAECDAQRFNEKTEDQREYEKEQEKYFVENGYKVCRYAEKEIIESPFAVAHDIIKNLAGPLWEFYEFVKIDLDDPRGVDSTA